MLKEPEFRRDVRFIQTGKPNLITHLEQASKAFWQSLGDLLAPDRRTSPAETLNMLLSDLTIVEHPSRINPRHSSRLANNQRLANLIGWIDWL
jgi:hypothetical protein